MAAPVQMPHWEKKTNEELVHCKRKIVLITNCTELIFIVSILVFLHGWLQLFSDVNQLYSSTGDRIHTLIK